MKYLYLHGLGQKPDSWDRVIKETKVSDRSVSLSLAEMLEGKAATYRELYTAFSEECNKENDEIVLCGLSLGAVLALDYAIDHVAWKDLRCTNQRGDGGRQPADDKADLSLKE